MPIITSLTQDAIMDIVNDLVKTVAIDGSGDMTATTNDGTVVAIGSVVSSIPTATTSAAGVVELATNAKTEAGTDAASAVTPASLAAALALILSTTTVAGLIKIATTAQVTTGTDTTTAITPAQLATKQASSAVLTTLAAITPTASDVMQYEGTAWTHRSPSQLATDLVAAAPIVEGKVYSGSAWGSATGAITYVGSVDPTASGAVANGSIWFDTSGT